MSPPTADYHIVVTLLDRSSPNAARRLLRGTASTRSAGRTAHQTPTGLPGALDLEIADAPSFFPAKGFWQDLSGAPTTRLGERWDTLEEREERNPTVEWYEPDSVKGSAGFTPAPTLDYRFGPVSLDWIDHPGKHPVFGNLDISVMAATPSSVSYASLEASTSALPTPSTSARSPAGSKLPSSAPVPSAQGYAQPTALFVPSSNATGKNRYQLGTTDLGYGSVHLYRDARAAEQDADLQRANATLLARKASGVVQKGDGTVVGVLAIPSYMTASDFLAFIAPAVEAIESIRILRDAMPHRSIGLIRFRIAADANTFAKEFNGKPFSHLQEREICHVARIASIEMKASLIPPFTFPALLPPDLLTQSAHELPTCPVCLERMDATVTGLMTISCAHTFHCFCLSKWGDSRCPVCRYSQTRLRCSTAGGYSSNGPSECAACGSEANLWICLICGHVGCGRYQGGHAHRHFEESQHTYALELGSQRVWDYVGDGYVHRLIQTRNDEIVELPALSSAVFDSGGGPGRDAVAHQSKIEAISEEFGTLVASQLDSQRAFYEKEIRFLQEDLDLAQASKQEAGDLKDQLDKERLRSRALENKLDALTEEALLLKEEVQVKAKREAEQARDKVRVEKKAEKAAEAVKRLEKELGAEKSLRQGIHAKVIKLEQEKGAGEQRVANLEGQVRDLTEQLRDVMFFLDAKTKIENEGGEEMQGGTVALPPPPPPPKATTRRKKK